MSFFNKKLSHEELAFEKQQEDAARDQEALEKLQNRYGFNLPFIYANATKRKVSGKASYFFNIVSALGLFYVVSLFLEVIHIPYFNYIGAGLALLFFEWSKRYFSDSFWDEFYFNRIELKKSILESLNLKTGFINFILLFGLSLAGTAFGLYFYTTDASPEAIALKLEIQEVKKSIAVHEGNQSFDEKHGVMRVQFQSETVLDNKLYPKLEKLEAELAEAEAAGKTKGDTSEAGISYSVQRSKFRVWGAVGLSILFELLFEICMAFNSKFDFLKLKHLVRQRKKNSSSGGPSSSSGSKQLTYDDVIEIVNESMKKVWQNMSEHVQTEENTKVADKYTIEHTDFVNQKKRRLTLDQIHQNIKKYEVRVQEAIDKSMKPAVLENREDKLKYWKQLYLKLMMRIQSQSNMPTEVHAQA